MLKKYISDMKTEFAGYNGTKFGQDFMAGLTVVAVALPLALAFGVSSGADAAAGLITAIISGIIISILSGASFQISGPTGAMTAVLITVVSRFGLQGVFVASLMAGVILLVCGILKLGKLVGYIPAPVVTGFTSGIAVIIALGQIDNFFGTTSQGETAIAKLLSYTSLGFSPNWQAVIVGGLVVLIMALYPKKWNEKVPSSLVSIIIAGTLSMTMHFDVATVGSIPKTLFPANRLLFSSIDLSALTNLIAPAITIASLGMIESLLCGASASRMKDEAFDADRELIAQGIGNMLIPFFGGVPATAAIARTSVAIKSGCQTRVTGIVHALGILASMFLLGDIMSKLPLAALAGVLMVTAYRMNEWESIRYMFGKKYKGAIIKFLVTMCATVIFDLTVAIIIGIVVSILLFVRRASNIEIGFSKVENKRFRSNVDIESSHKNTMVAYITGPLFFATSDKLKGNIESIENCETLILSMRGVATMDMSGLQALMDVVKSLQEQGIKVIFCGVQHRIMEYLSRSGIKDLVGIENFYFSVDRALLTEEQKNCA